MKKQSEAQIEKKLEAKRIRKEKIANRVWEVDALRGLAILGVLWDHFMHDAAYVYSDAFHTSGKAGLAAFSDFATSYFDGNLRLYARPIFVFIFFFVSGLCTIFSKNNGIRGFKLLFVALAVTILTYLAELIFKTSGILIAFGVLHCLAICMLIFAGIDFILNKSLKEKSFGKWVKFAVYAILAIIILVLNHFYNMSLFDKDQIFESHSNGFVGFFVYSSSFLVETNDYFPLLPFLGFFFIGAALAPLVYQNKKSLLPKVNRKLVSPLTVPGRYSLIIYLLAQVVFFVLLSIVSLIAFGKLGFV